MQGSKDIELLYTKEHISCRNYDDGANPLIEVVDLHKNENWDISTQENKIVYVVKGKIKFLFNGFSGENLSQSKAIILPAGTKFVSKAEKDTSICVLRLRSHIKLCDRYSIERLLKDENVSDLEEQTTLQGNEILQSYMQLLYIIVKDGLKCISLFEIKLKELFFILRGYYPKKELLGFFYPLLTNDTSFSNQILFNHYKAKTVKDLADLTHYSVSGFEKRFKKAFNVPPSQWLKEQRAKNIYHEINCTHKTLKEISLEFGFASPAHLNEFCKSYFGITPGKIRKENIAK